MADRVRVRPLERAPDDAAVGAPSAAGAPRHPASPAAASAPAPSIRPAAGEGPPSGGIVARALSALEHPLARLEALVSHATTHEWNPLVQTGAIANTLLIVAILSGVAVLIWYVPEVHQAHGSVAGMDLDPYRSGLVRSIHRYSSDACMLFVLLHALQVFAARRFTGPRWLSWATGAILLALLWLVGWLGYWLVWDARAHGVATGTARLLDVLPIFADPLSRSFLADDMVGSATFFTVFFVHMLLPLPMGVALWLHVTRISHPRLLPRRALNLWICGSLLALSLAWPATAAAPARMAHIPERFTMDWWYLAPLALTDRLSGGALWATLLTGGAVVFSVPLWLGKRRAAPVRVEEARCNACEECSHDCPFDAIRMVPRTDGKVIPGRPLPLVSHVDPSKCVACGVCVGSCSTTAIDLPWLPARAVTERLERSLAEAAARAGERERVAVVCAHAIGADIAPEAAETITARMPGYEVVVAPCAAWANQTLLARVLRRGAPGVLVAACEDGACLYRDGADIALARIAGAREPRIVPRWARDGRVRSLRVTPGDVETLAEAAAEFRGAPAGAPPAFEEEPECDEGPAGDAAPPPPEARRSPGRIAAAGLAIAAVACLLTGLGSDLPYAGPRIDGALLAVSLKHPGRTVELPPVPAAEAARAKLPPHMRAPRSFERRRSDVRLRVTVDGVVRLERVVPPAGLWSDSASIALEHLALEPGRRRVRVDVGDDPEGREWAYSDERLLELSRGERRAVLFERERAFKWR
jgi:ferredoxin